ncbi:hypothetical protein niasHT_033704 [Heterodera trifolii]|uniref:Equilibrative nucleoside transporter 1 n=1 Tax=Heterodera trifolii TaxID=157864 RepID=A0ABD2IB90_9BILA
MTTGSDRTQLQMQLHFNANNSSEASQSQNSSEQMQDCATNERVVGEDSVPFIDRETFGDAENDIGRGPPPDRFRLVYLIVLLHGMGMLLPWNTFITIAGDYYLQFKFANVSNEDNYKVYFFNYLTVCAQIPNLLLSFLNLFVVIRGGFYRRIYFTLAVIFGICLVTIAMVYVPTDNWTFGFFLFTMVSVVLLNSASGVYQNSIWGLVADFPGEFAGAIILGNNLCGILMAVLYILIIVLVGANPALAATVYFGLALFTVVLCIFSFLSIQKLNFYNYYVQKAAKARANNGTNILHEEETGEAKANRKVTHPPLKTYVAIFSEVRRQLLDVWLVFFVTLALFPTVLLKVSLISPFNDQKTSESLYKQLTVFLNFNVWAAVGCWLSGFSPRPSPNYLSLPICLRLLFLPLFWFCDYQYDNLTPRRFVFIHNQWVFTVLITLMALSHGYCSSLAMVYAPKKVNESKSQVVGMMSGFFLVLGIASGILFTFVEPSLVYALEDFFGIFY